MISVPALSIPAAKEADCVSKKMLNSKYDKYLRCLFGKKLYGFLKEFCIMGVAIFNLISYQNATGMLTPPL